MRYGGQKQQALPIAMYRVAGRMCSRLSTHLLRRSVASLAYTVPKKGALGDVLTARTVDVPEVTANSVLVRWLAAGIDDVDFASASGHRSAAQFAARSNPQIGGTEGVAVVKAVGSDVQSVAEGDFVIPVKVREGQSIMRY